MRTTLTVVVALAAACLLSCGPKTCHTDVKTESVAQVEPLLLEDEPLLLEDEGPLLLGNDDSDTNEGADNSRCHVCHINYTQDSMAITHAKAGMGCATCHGESDAHIADESWASGGNGTAPDKMYIKAEINPFCLDCHKAETLPETEHEAVLVVDTVADTKKVCTDCHGNHRLPTRRCKWK